MSKPKIITLDIETSPIVAYVWGLFKQFVSPSQIVRDWAILSYCAKTLGEKEVRYKDNSKKARYDDDKDLMLALWKELDEADIVVTQNGIRFDIKKINARFLIHDLPPPSPYKVIDTMVEAKKIAALTSNKLEWLAKVLAGGKKDNHADFPGFELWLQCMAGNKKAWASMRKYNPQDVIETEAVYLKLRPYMVGHPNVAAYDADEEMVCPKCGSDDIVQRGFAYTQTGKYQRIKCKGCGGWSRTRYTENTIEKRRSLLSN